MIPIPYFNCLVFPLYFNTFTPHCQNYSPLSSGQQTNKTQQLPKNGLRGSLQNFIKNTGGAFPRDLSINYMKLSHPYSDMKIKDNKEFERFYIKIIRKYEEYYDGDRMKKSWGKNDIEILIWIVHKLAISRTFNPTEWSFLEWELVASLIPFRTAEGCKFKWLALRKNQLKSNPWSGEQIQLLFEIIRKEQNSGVINEDEIDWNQVSQKLFYGCEAFRTAKQCRECWNIQVKSHHESKKLWSKQEDQILLQKQKLEGRKWKNISSFLPGRSQNAIKNRFNLLSSKSSSKDEVKLEDALEHKQRISEITEYYVDVKIQSLHKEN